MGGEPRFCSEFDLFLSALGTDVAVDWFMMFWSNSQPGGTHGFDLVSKNWLAPTVAWARGCIESNLPRGHRLVALELRDRRSVITPQISNHAGETSPERMWGMYNSIYLADQLRRAHEAEWGHYDLVIRCRPDVGLSGQINFNDLADRSGDQVIFTPNSEQHGYGLKINDMIAIGRSQAMTAYMDAVHWIPEYYRRGLIFHPETMLAYHCQAQGLRVEACDWGSIVLRKLGQQIPNGPYISDYGRWA